MESFGLGPALGQVARQTRYPRAGSPRRTRVYVEGCLPARNEVWRSKLTQCWLPCGPPSGNVSGSENRDACVRWEVRDLYPYETLVIFDPRLADEEVGVLLIKLQEHLKALGAEVGKAESWGKRRLAYDIRKQREGTYAVLESSATPATVKEFERQLGLNEQVLRFLSTRVPVRKRVRSAPKQQPVAAEEVV